MRMINKVHAFFWLEINRRTSGCVDVLETRHGEVDRLGETPTEQALPLIRFLFIMMEQVCCSRGKAFNEIGSLMTVDHKMSRFSLFFSNEV